MKEAVYVDAKGREWAVLLPDGVPDSEAELGLPLGPPPLDSLDLPEDTQTRLHNQLRARRIYTYEDAKRRRQEVFAALQAAFRVETESIVQLYNERLFANGSEPEEAPTRRGKRAQEVKHG